MTRAFACTLNVHAGRRSATACGREHAFTLDLDHACTAVAVRAHAGHVAKARDVGAEPHAIGGLQDRLFERGNDVDAVETKRDAFAGHFDGARRIHDCTSCGKYFTTDAIGFGAA